MLLGITELEQLTLCAAPAAVALSPDRLSCTVVLVKIALTWVWQAPNSNWPDKVPTLPLSVPWYRS